MAVRWHRPSARCFVRFLAAAVGITALVTEPSYGQEAVQRSTTPLSSERQTPFKIDVPAKDNARDGLEGVIRPLVRRLQASADVDDSEQAAMGIGLGEHEMTARPSPNRPGLHGPQRPTG